MIHSRAYPFIQSLGFRILSYIGIVLFFGGIIIGLYDIYFSLYFSDLLESWRIGLLSASFFCMIWISFVPIIFKGFFFSKRYLWWQHLLYVWVTIMVFVLIVLGVPYGMHSNSLQFSSIQIVLFMVGGAMLICGIFVYFNFFFRRRIFARRAKELSDILMQLNESEPVYRNEIHIHERGKSVLNTTSRAMLYIQGEGRFCYAYYQTDQEVRRKFIERRLEGLYQDLDSLPQIIRMNEDHLVNIHNIARFEGNAQGIFALLLNSDLPPILIRRSYLAALLDRIRSFMSEK